MTKTETIETEGNPNALVAFLDILGTRERVRSGRFGRITAHDFVNPVGAVARMLPRVRFAAFSDSVLISADVADAGDFLAALAFVHRQWFSDLVFVRGGISLGEIDWVDDKTIDQLFEGTRNFLYARVYGRALVEAHRLEQSAGPGALCTVSQAAVSVLRRVCNESIFDGPASYLIWSDSRGVGWFAHLFRGLVQNALLDSDAWRHYRATLWYFEQLYFRRIALPPEIPSFLPGSNEWIELEGTSA